MTTVVHCKLRPFDVYIGRPSKWGNPFSHLTSSRAMYKADSRQHAIELYGEWIKTQPKLLASLGELKDKTLGCWCYPLPCHGDVLAKMADEL